jgi:hypothetical protein
MSHPRLDPKSRFLFLAVLAIYPLLLVAIEFSPSDGFLKIARFGEKFFATALPEIQAIDPPRKNADGYDGQFYVQMALDPTLQRPELEGAIDDFGYRAQRIGLPALAYVVGGGKPTWIVQVYCLLNLGFWGALLWVVVQLYGVETFAQRTSVVATVWTAGVLVSVTRGLSDMSALCLGLVSVWLISSPQVSRWRVSLAIAIAGISGLFKETALLSFPGCIDVDFSKRPIRWLVRSALAIGLMLVPIVLWQLYVRTQIGGGRSGLHNFTWPLLGVAEALWLAFQKSITNFPRIPLLEIIGPISMIVQVAYLLKRWRMSEPMWRFALGYALLAIFLAIPVWESQSAYSRVLLPVVVVFNYYLMRDRNRLSTFQYYAWFWAANIGVLDRAAPALLFWCLYEWWERERNKRSGEASTSV